jgi:Flp pilus assembly protein TadB
MVSTEEILNKYGSKIEAQMNSLPTEPTYSQEYVKFKQDMLPQNSRYERWAQTLGNLVKIKVSEKEQYKIEKYLSIAHLEVTAGQAVTLAAMSFILVFMTVVLATAALYFFTGTFQLLFLFLGIIATVFVFYYTYGMPQRIANSWRLKASSQMVPAVLYVVVYMKHTSNLEKAIEFASQHLEVPLALDFKKIFWDVEIGKYSTIKQSLDDYLDTWRDYSPEFVESFHLIESSLFEPDEARRVATLEKGLQVILEGVYEKMLSYSREIRTPLTNMYMIGIILPTLGLALLPLASTLLSGIITWQQVFVLFDIIIPFFVFYMTSEVLLKRPGGHGESSVLELNPEYYKFTSKKPWAIAALFCIPLLIIGILPFIFQISWLTDALGLQNDYTLGQVVPFWQDSTIKLFDFKKVDGSLIGPFGPLGILLSLFIPLSLGMFFSMVYKMKTKDLINARKETRELESEFTNSIFQLGNRLGDGIPAEIAFARVAATTQGQRTQSFFALVNQNIQQLGMSVEEAIFNKQRGAILYYPSALIATSMRILIESVRKGLQVAARSLMSISEYVKNIKKIDERLRDLLAEVVSDMKSNMVFLAPLLAGIVVGLSAMITSILNKLESFSSVGDTQEIAGFGSVSNILKLFDIRSMIPPYYLQAAIGIYIVEIIFILTAALVTVDAGKDPLREKYELASNIKKGLFLYLATALISIVALSVLSAVALNGIGG